MSEPVRVGQAGLGNWGQNLVRNLDELAQLTWLCDTSDDLRARFAAATRTRGSRRDFDDLLEDDELEAIVIATPVPTHFELARPRDRCRQACVRGEASCDAP